MNRLFLIDSSAWIFALGARPVPEIRDRVAELVDSNLAALTSPIYFELASAAASSAETPRLLDYLSSLHPFPLLPEDWLQAASWLKGLRQKGLKAKTMDALIAYKAHKHGLVLLHADSDLDRIASAAGVETESYVRLVRARSGGR